MGGASAGVVTSGLTVVTHNFPHTSHFTPVDFPAEALSAPAPLNPGCFPEPKGSRPLPCAALPSTARSVPRKRCATLLKVR